jgi:hypothetical protein
MPCRDFYDDHPSAYYESEVSGLRRQVSFAESVLCQTLAALEKAVGNPLDLIDYREAGVTRSELEKWWKNHKALDAKHRAEEAAKKKEAAEKRAKAKKRKELLAKMSDEEKEILGLK